MNQLLAKMPSSTYFDVKGFIGDTTYKSDIPQNFAFSPRNGKTVVSIHVSPYFDLGEKSENAKFTMPGEKKPWILEVAIPNPHNFQSALTFIRDMMQIPSNILVEEELMGDLSSGVDTYLALEIARHSFKPETASFTLADIVNHEPLVDEVLDEMKRIYPKHESDIMESLKGQALTKF